VTTVDVAVTIDGPPGWFWRRVPGAGCRVPREPAARPGPAGRRRRAGRRPFLVTRSLATEFTAAEDGPGLLLCQVTNRWQAAQRAALKPFGLTHVQFVLLASLTWLEAEGPVTQRRLAAHAATDPMMTSQVLRALEERGLVVRRPHPHDRRARALAVTRKGASLANRSVRAVEECDRSFFGDLGEDVPRLVASLRRLIGLGR
jgi:DNA-binding MarR family transcriptional regulator